MAFQHTSPPGPVGDEATDEDVGARAQFAHDIATRAGTCHPVHGCGWDATDTYMSHVVMHGLMAACLPVMLVLGGFRKWGRYGL